MSKDIETLELWHAGLDKQIHLISLREKPKTTSILKKEMELELIRLVESYKAQGLDFAYFTIDTSQKGIFDARVLLNEATDISEQATDLNPTNQST